MSLRKTNPEEFKMTAERKYPKYINGIAVYSDDEKNSFCHICPGRLLISSEEHLRDANHLSIFDCYIKNFNDNGPFATCKLCSQWLEYSTIIEHAVSHKLLPWYKPSEDSKIFLKGENNREVSQQYPSHEIKKLSGDSTESQELELGLSFCTICHLPIDPKAIDEHLKTFSTYSASKKHELDGFFIVKKLSEAAESLLNSPESHVDAVLEDLELQKSIDKIKEDELLGDLRDIVVEKYPNAVPHPFGSRISGLGGKDSDLDIFIDCSTEKNSLYFGNDRNSKSIEEELKIIKKCLESNSNRWSVEGEILNCKIPIIKAKHKPTDIKCDISFTNGLGVENTKLIRNYCEKSIDCRKLIIFVKNWMKNCQLTRAMGIRSYGIAWLVIYFLQTKKILPTVHQLIKMKNKSRIIAGWETGVIEDFKVEGFGGGFEQLLKQFFEFYENFDYRNDVMCPLIGETVKKIDFENQNELPSAMLPYLNYLNSSINCERFSTQSTMCLQDPFDLAHNITKSMEKFKIYKFKTYCCHSAQIIGNNL